MNSKRSTLLFRIACIVAFGAAFVVFDPTSEVYSQIDMAKRGRCLLEINGRKFLSGKCDIRMDDSEGSFTIGEIRRGGFYFAMVQIDPDGTARGYWNGSREASHAHDSLGTLARKGACWVNRRAKICAWR